MENVEEKTKETKVEETLKPPYGNVSWYESFFDLIRSRDFDKFDREIIELNIIKGTNAGMLFNGLRFLGLVDENGKTNEKFKSLRRVGDEFKQNLKKVVTEGYSVLFSKIVVENAKPETLLNFFVETYDYGEATAAQVRKIFIYLCKQSDIALSKELLETEAKLEKGRKEAKPKEEKKEARQATPSVLEGMHKIEWGDTIRIYLKHSEEKSEREKVANQAIKLIEMYKEG